MENTSWLDGRTPPQLHNENKRIVGTSVHRSTLCGGDSLLMMDLSGGIKKVLDEGHGAALLEHLGVKLVVFTV